MGRYTTIGTTAAIVFKKTLNITSNVNNYNLYNAAVAAGWPPTKRIRLTLNISSGVTIGSSSTSTPALDISGFKAVDDITVINSGNIFGRGGAGGAGGTSSSVNGQPGGAGGPALRVVAPSKIKLINNGIIGGGSGGNGGAGAIFQQGYTTPCSWGAISVPSISNPGTRCYNCSFGNLNCTSSGCVGTINPGTSITEAQYIAWRNDPSRNFAQIHAYIRGGNYICGCSCRTDCIQRCGRVIKSRRCTTYCRSCCYLCRLTCTFFQRILPGASGTAGANGGGANGIAGANNSYLGGAGGVRGNYFIGNANITQIAQGTLRGGVS